MSMDSPIVDEVRCVREQISEECDHDIHRYFERLRKIEAKYKDRVVSQLTVVRPSDAQVAHQKQR